jgi:FMN phosphatase YigB (HAD superfamily)
MDTKKIKLKAIISDFDGVLCNQNFFWTLEKTNPELLAEINFFFQNERDIINSWMRGEFDYQIFCQKLSSYLEQKNISYNINLEKELLKSVRKITLNKPLLKYLKKQRKKGLKIAIYTDNMDVFSLITIPQKKLNKYFDEIHSSFALKELKRDNNQHLLNSLLKKLDARPEEVLILEDNGYIKENFRKQGFNFFQFYRKDSYPDALQKFKKYFEENYKF